MDSVVEQSAPTFSADERESFSEYRSLSLLAVTSLLLGILSVGALSYPGLWIVPLVAVFCGAFALRAIRKSDHVSGKFTAWAGIALALMFLSWAVSQYYFGRWVIYAEAQAVAERWIQFVLEGEDKIAHQAMLNPATRQSVGFSVDEYYQMDEKAREDMEKLFSEPPMSEMLGLGKEAKIELQRNITQDLKVGEAKLIRQIYRITAPNKSPIDAMITMTRQFRPEQGRATWIVAEVGKPE